MDWLRHTVSAAERVVARSTIGLASNRQNSSSPAPSSPSQQRPRSLMITSEQETTFTSLPSPLLIRQRNRSMEQSATLPRRTRSASTTAMSDMVLKRVETPVERPHARDIKCTLCYDQTVMFADQEQSRLFRRWFSTYQNGSQQEESQKEQYDLLFEHIKGFNQRYNAAVLPPPEKDLCTTLRPLNTPDGRGHPSYAVICAVNGLCDLLKVFCDSAAHVPCEVSATIKDVLILMEHIEILSRWPENCRCMISHQLADILLQFFIEVVTVYKKLDKPASTPQFDSSHSGHSLSRFNTSPLPLSTISSQSSHDDAFHEGEALERIITLICEVLRRLADPTEEWVQHFRTWKSEPSITAERSLWSLLTPQHTREFQRKIIQWLLYFILYLQRDNAPPMTLLQMYAYFQAMHLLGALVWHCNVDYLLLQELSVLDLLTAFIGDQRLVLQWQRTQNILGFSGEHCQIVRGEFRSRLFAWRIVFAMELAVPEMRSHFLRSVTRSNITELFSWTIRMCTASETRTDLENKYIDMDQFPLLASIGLPDVVTTPTTSSSQSAGEEIEGEEGAPTLECSVSEFQNAYEADNLSSTAIAMPPSLSNTMPTVKEASEIRILFYTALSMLLVNQQRNEVNPSLSALASPVLSESKSFRRNSTISMHSSGSSLVLSDTMPSCDSLPTFWNETFNMIIRVFDDQRSESASSPLFIQQHPMDRATAPPFAQLAFLSFLAHLVYAPAELDETALLMVQDRRLWCLQLCADLRIWDTLLADSFYLRKSIGNGDNSQLRTVILQFIVYTTVVSRQTTHTQCGKLLTLLFIHRDDPTEVVNVCRALLTVLTYHREAAQESLKRLNCLAELTALLRESAGIEEAAMMRSAQSSYNNDDVKLDAWQLTLERRRLFWVLLPLLDRLLLNHRELAILARRDEDMLAILFGMLFHVHTAVSQFAIRHLVNIISSVCIEVYVGVTENRRVSQVPSDIIARYMDIIPVELTQKHAFEVQLRLINGIGDAIRQFPAHSMERHAVQEALVAESTFEHLLAMLHIPIEVAEWNDSEKQWRVTERLICITRTLMALCVDAPEHCDRLAELSGYHSLCEHAQSCEWGEEVFNLFFDVVANNDRYNELAPANDVLQSSIGASTAVLTTSNQQLEIRNPHMIDALAALLPKLNPETQFSLLDRFTRLANHCDLNRWFLAESCLTSNLLCTEEAFIREDQAFIAKWIMLLERICSYSVRVPIVKNMLSAICYKAEPSITNTNTNMTITSMATVKTLPDIPERSAELPVHHGALLHVMYTIAQHDDSMDFFHFRGGHSGLHLNLASLNTSNGGGLTFCTWIHLDKPAGSLPLETPRLFSFLNDDTSGIEAYLDHGYLYARILSHSSVVVEICSRSKLATNRWQFVTITFRPSQRGWGSTQAELAVFVDGEVSTKASFEESIDAMILNRCAIGAQLVGHEDELAFINGFCGRMATIYVIEDSLSARQIGAINQLGRRHASQFLPEQMLRYPKQSGFLFDQGFAAKVAYCLHAKATEGDQAFNLAYRGGKATELVSGVNHTTFYDVERCSTVSLQRAIHSLGGIEVFFPLMLRFDAMTTESYLAPFQAQDDYFADHGPVQAFFLLISAMLRRNRVAQENVARAGDFRLITYLLQQVAPRHMQPVVYRCIVTLANNLTESDELVRQIYRDLLLEFRLWLYTPLDVQIYCLQSMKSCIESKMEFFRLEFGVQYFLDALHVFYWYEPNEHSVSERHNATGALRPSQPDDVASLRGIVLEIIRSMLSRQAERDDILLLFRSMLISNDQRHIYEIITLLTRLLRRNDTTLLDTFSVYGFELICELLRRGNASVKCAVTRLMRFLLQCKKISERWKRRLRFEDLDASVVSAMFAGCQLTQELYAALLALAVEDDVTDLEEEVNDYHVSDEVNTNDNAISSSSTSRLWSRLTLPSIRNMKMIALLLESASNPATTTAVRVLLLQDMLKLFKKNSGNCTRLRLMPGWQRCLVDLIPRNALSTPTHDEEDNTATSNNSNSNNSSRDTVRIMSETEQCGHLAISLLVIICWNLFDNDKTGQRMAEEALYFAWSSTRTDRTEIVRAILIELLQHALEETRTTDGTQSITKMENIAWLLNFSEEFMFNSQYFAEFTEDLDDLLAKHEALKSEDIVFKYSINPWEDSAKMSMLVLSVASALDHALNRQAKPNSILRRMRTGGCCRIQLRVLLSGISSTNSSIRDQSTTRLIEFLKLHVPNPELPNHQSVHGNGSISSANGQAATTITTTTITTGNSAKGCAFSGGIADRMYSMLGQMHETYMISRLKPETTEYDYQDSCSGEPSLNGQADEVVSYAFLCVLRQCHAMLMETIPPRVPQPEWPLVEEQQELELFVQSVAWKTIYDELLLSALKQAEDEEIAAILTSVTRFVKEIRQLLTAQRKRDNVADSQGGQLRDSITHITQPLQEDEKSRLAAWTVETRSEHARTLRRWRNKQQELTRERGVWHSKKGPQTRWKLDRTENASRMRGRMVVNYDFDNHEMASARRDKLDSTKRISRASKRFSVDRLGLALQSDDGSSAESSIGASPFNPFSLDQMLQGSIANIVDATTAGTNVEDEEWSLISGDDIHAAATDGNTDRISFSANCELVVLLSSIKGVLELTNSSLSFIVDRANLIQALEEGSVIFDPELLRDRKWLIADICEIHFRKYLLRKSALEFFMTDRTSYFFQFPDIKDRHRLYTKLVLLRPPSLINAGSRSPAEMLRRSGLTQRWIRHEVSNFDYLMHLNSIAGRSYNDLTQYFVFPWVLTDYDSDKIDLADPSIYRDLSKPVGALNPTRLEYFNERYESFDDPTGRIKKFHYGTHYSSAATVAFYLLRLEPFTSIHISLQGGKFDHADRQFHSIQGCWHSCLTGAADVKELIPEFFYMPEFLVNDNGLDLGVQQKGERLNDVILPNWADSPEAFVRINREALESDYVSENLHHWIDLIFGYKQKGEEAVKAYNVFYYLTYEGAIEIDAITDAIERKAVEEQIYHFGQTPTQLLRAPHPRRASRNPSIARQKLLVPKHQVAFTLILTGFTNICYVAVTGVGQRSNWSSMNPLHVIGIDDNGRIAKEHLPGHCIDRRVELSGDRAWLIKRRVSCPFSYDIQARSRCFAAGINAQVVVTTGHWDDSFKLIDADTCRVLQSPHGDGGTVTCTALSEDARWLVTGSKSTAIFAWQSYTIASGQLRVNSQPCTTYHGHDDEVITCAVNAEYDLLVSGSKDGTCIVHALRSGDYLRSIRPVDDVTCRVELVKITRCGHIVVYAEAKKIKKLCVYTLNGRLLASINLMARVVDAAVTADGKYLAIADEQYNICIHQVYDLSIHYQLQVDYMPCSLNWLDDGDQLFAPRRDPRLLVVGCVDGIVSGYRLLLD